LIDLQFRGVDAEVSSVHPIHRGNHKTLTSTPRRIIGRPGLGPIFFVLAWLQAILNVLSHLAACGTGKRFRRPSLPAPKKMPYRRRASSRLPRDYASNQTGIIDRNVRRLALLGHLFNRWGIRKQYFLLRSFEYTIYSPTVQEVEEMQTISAEYSVFWQPGCSSCVRVKEFLTRLEIPFKSVNVLSDNEGRSELRRLGARSIPIVSKGDAFTYAQSIEDVARFVDRMDAVTDRLPPEVLFSKWTKVLSVALAIIPMIPDDSFRSPLSSSVPRTYRDLSYHIFQVVDAFLQTVQDGLEDWTLVANIEPHQLIQAKEDTVKEGQELTEKLQRWWLTLEDKSCQQSLKMFYGEHPMHQFLERSTWHSAQHTRQLIALLSEKGIELPAKLDAEDYAGLPMPKQLWE
jgi:glutaredoxin